MKYLLPAVLLTIQAVMGQGDTGGVQIGRSHYLEGLRKDVNELQQKIFEEEQRFARLMRLKIHWELLLPVRVQDLYEGTQLSTKSPQDLAAELAQEIQREVRLKTRFRRSGGIESDTPLPRIKDLIPNPAPGPGAKDPARAKTDRNHDRTEVGEASPKAGASVPSRDWGPLMMKRSSVGPTIERSHAMTPFATSGDLTIFAPSAFLTKRIRALIGAGMSTEALAVLGARLEILKDAKQDPEPSLLFLKAKTLESLGELAQATQVYTQVTDLDRGTNADGKDVFGIWAKSANFALEHLRWLEANREYQPPDIKELK